jgi:hypothetical protein
MNNNNDKNEVLEVIKKINPLLEKNKMPGQRFRMPSRGLFYTNGELADTVKDGEVEVFPMKTIDEINLKTPDLIFQGNVIERVFKRCIPEIVKPMELLSNDVDYLMAALWKVSHGNSLPIKTTCECTNHKTTREYTIPLDKLLAQNTVELDKDKLLSEYNFEITNPSTNVTLDIQLKPIKYDNLVSTYQTQSQNLVKYNDFTVPEGLDDEEKEKYTKEMEESMEHYISLILSSMIESVDGITDRDNIEEWVLDLRVPMKKQLSEKIEKVSSWGVKFDYTVNCFDCGKPIDVSPMLNPVSFFSQSSSQTEG